MSENQDVEKIKVFSSEDDKLKVLGELLGNKSSRDIIKLLISQEMYVNQIAKKIGLQPNLVLYHIQKMELIGLVEVTAKQIIKKGEEHKFYKIPIGMLIFPEKTHEDTTNCTLKKFFKDGIKFVAIGIVATVSYAIQLNSTNEGLDITGTQSDLFIIPLMIIVLGLVIERVISKKKKKRLESPG